MNFLPVAQTDIPIFTWRSHLSYNNIIDITASDARLYAAAQNALFYIDLDDMSINKITKSDGLSDVAIGAIHYDESLQLLIVGYANGNIDLIYEDRIVNIPLVKDADVIGDKKFHDIKVDQGSIYMANDLGIFVVDPNRAEISESYRNLSPTGMQLRVNEISIVDQTLFAATPSGILSISLQGNINRQDFNNWNRTLTSLEFENLIESANRPLASSANRLFEYEGGSWNESLVAIAEPIIDLNSDGSDLFILTKSAISTLNGNTLETVRVLDENSPTNVIFASPSVLWIGTQRLGLQKQNGATIQNFSPPGPANDRIAKLDHFSGQIISLSGGFDIFRNPLNLPGYLSTFAEGRWNFEEIELDGLRLQDLVDIEINNTDAFFLASFQHGLVNTATSALIDDNSPGSTLERKDGILRVSAITREGDNLWIATHDFENSIHKWNTLNDTWESFSFGFTASEYPLDILALPNGDKWVALDANIGGGILVFNDETGRSRYLTTNGGQGGLPGREITSMILDDNGFLWIGTGAGVAFFPNPISVLQGGSLTASVPIFENSFLLRNEFITSLIVDAGNRKWIGTLNNGIWLFSETGEELVHHFTTENSPLPSDEITEIKTNDSTGEVFIGTASGLVSFRSDAIGNQSLHANVKAFPNPVTRDFSGVVTITGLVESAEIKITDSSGKLVRELKGRGSSVTWDARDYNGNRVKTGVYLIFSSNSDGTETFVSKIVVI